ncbi:acetate/propionate family kinase [Haloplasma contractile]|uniref:Acetate kinase n=1 Tax=Haloplasma contractile SSD-17B TaxID=1033810 RepID=F7PWI2_9MOLU|nr:acetate kinase [Haloplasma contractile]ERJ10980.1 Acetate kinase protein [Haloplasma contractile SSD-17B]
MAKILAVNAGSSSLKFQLLNMPEEDVIASGLVERIGFEDAVFNIEFRDQERSETVHIPDHAVAVQMLLEVLVDLQIVKSLEDIVGVGHRVVHGGEKFSDSVKITDEVLKTIEELKDLAPLHNPANATGIRAFEKVLPKVEQVAVFDTAFHQTMPKESYMYASPYDWYEKYGVRRYGFHGTSHKYVAERTAQLINKSLEDTKIITVHIGNGGSLAAVDGGKSVNTSMGFTPLAGLVMGTRTGDIDPSILPFVMEKENMNIDEAISALNKESGLEGVSGISSDMRDIDKGKSEDNERAELAFDLFVKRVVDYIAAYYVELGGADAIVFTAGIGENDIEVRKAVMSRLAVLGIKINEEANNTRGQEIKISTDDSKIQVWVVPTNEEVMIARDTLRLIK